MAGLTITVDSVRDSVAEGSEHDIGRLSDSDKGVVGVLVRCNPEFIAKNQQTDHPRNIETACMMYLRQDEQRS